MTPLKLAVLPANLPGGAVTLTQQGSDINVYNDNCKDIQQELPKSIDLSTSTLPAQYFLEGIAPSGNGDQHFSLQYTWGALSLSDADAPQ